MCDVWWSQAHGSPPAIYDRRLLVATLNRLLAKDESEYPHCGMTWRFDI